MTRIICRVSACVYWEQGECGAEEIEYELDDGCLTFQDMGDLQMEDDDEDDLDWKPGGGSASFDDDDDDDDDDDLWDGWQAEEDIDSSSLSSLPA